MLARPASSASAAAAIECDPQMAPPASSIDLNAFFLCLMDACINRKPATEQRALAEMIEPIFNKGREAMDSTYGFLTPPARATPRQEVNKKKQQQDVAVTSTPTPTASSSRPLTGRSRPRQFPSSHSIGGGGGGTRSASSDAPMAMATSTAIAIEEEPSLQRLLKAIERCEDDLSTVVLCRLLRGYASPSRASAGTRRLKRLAELDATNQCLRALRVTMAVNDSTPLNMRAIDELATVMLLISARDGKFMLKARLSGVLAMLVQRILLLPKRPSACTATLLRLAARCLRSPRNVQLVGKERNFAQHYIGVMSALNSSREKMGGGGEEKMARLVEIVFFLAKNRKNKSKLLMNDALPMLKSILETHFDQRHADPVHLEIALIVLAAIRRFSRTKKGKDQLIALSMLEMCERSIGVLAEDRKRVRPNAQLAAPFAQLQESLCALCMRCLPHIPFPQMGRFPLDFDLPVAVVGVVAVPGEGQANKVKGRPSTAAKARRSIAPGEEEDRQSSSDDAYNDEEEEEDESLLYVDSPLVDNNNGAVHYSPGEEEEEAEEAEDSTTPNKKPLKEDAQWNPLNYSRQKPSELKANYSHLFEEFSATSTTRGGVNRSRTIKRKVPTHTELISKAVQATTSVGRFIKVAYPEWVGAAPTVERRWPYLPPSDSFRETIVREMARSRLGERRVVFELDGLLSSSNTHPHPALPLTNNDEERIGAARDISQNDHHLLFESRFESGNLRRATQIGDRHYELILSPDINQSRPHYQWFYFEVSGNGEAGEYVFEIVNCLKNSSMFSKGMQPLLYSVTEAKIGRPGWERAGSPVFYYRNLYVDNEAVGVAFPSLGSRPKGKGKVASGGDAHKSEGGGDDDLEYKWMQSVEKGPIIIPFRNFYSVRFTIHFPHANDVCYLAYHFPYTFSYLNATLEALINRSSTPQMYVRRDSLAITLGGNDDPLLTITAGGGGGGVEVGSREIVLISARVHPGESNASWIMNGIIRHLLSDAPSAVRARQLFIFKLVPMLNPDGVINGSHRCSLAGVDLNRVWDRPHKQLHPTIYHTKGLIQYMVDVLKKRPLTFVDLHGHSRRANVFMYGNNPEQSWRPGDRQSSIGGGEDEGAGNLLANRPAPSFRMLPEILFELSSSFSLRDCAFTITKSKESSARIAMWRQFQLERTYTMEASYCGFDQGPMANQQINTGDLEAVGASLCDAIVALKEAVSGGGAGATNSTKVMRPRAAKPRRRSEQPHEERPPSGTMNGPFNAADANNRNGNGAAQKMALAKKSASLQSFS